MSRSPLEFPGTGPNITGNEPIIGQPEVKAVSITAVLVCPPPCNGILLIQGGIGAGVACKCGKTWTLNAAMMRPDGVGGISLSQGKVEPVKP